MLTRGTIKYSEAKEIAEIIGYTIRWDISHHNATNNRPRAYDYMFGLLGERRITAEDIKMLHLVL